jgi:hypothetical protein
MIITKKALARRTILRGLGASVALPLLDAMIPAMTAEARTPARPTPRLGYVYIPMGADMPRWTPATTGRLGGLTPILASLAPVSDHVTVVTGLEIKRAYSAGNHATANSGFLSAAQAKMTEGSDYRLATTVDQIAAQRIGRDTALPSLELAMDLSTAIGNCDNGFACVYQNNLSWSSPTTPMPTEAHPRIVFERLFGSGGSPSARRAELGTDASLLDDVTADLARLRATVGAVDRRKVDEYLTAVREVERRIHGAERRVGKGPPAPDRDRPAGVPAAYGDHARLMFDLQVLALQADATRVITFQLARETSNRTYPEVGVNDAHHFVTHHANDPVKVEKMSRINAYHVSLFAWFLARLKATVEGSGTLLDHGLWLCGSGMGNPDVHDHANLPILVAGGGWGRHRGGRHLRTADHTPIANLHLTMLRAAGVASESFADSTGPLADLLT